MVAFMWGVVHDRDQNKINSQRESPRMRARMTYSLWDSDSRGRIPDLISPEFLTRAPDAIFSEVSSRTPWKGPIYIEIELLRGDRAGRQIKVSSLANSIPGVNAEVSQCVHTLWILLRFRHARSCTLMMDRPPTCWQHLAEVSDSHAVCKRSVVRRSNRRKNMNKSPNKTGLH